MLISNFYQTYNQFILKKKVFFQEWDRNVALKCLIINLKIKEKTINRTILEPQLTNNQQM